MKSSKAMAFAALAGLVLTSAALTAPEAVAHFALKSAEPAVDATVAEAPQTIKLWFTEEPQDVGGRIRLLNAAGAAVELGAVAKGEEDKTMISAAVTGSVSPGVYTVAWRAMAEDGHIVSEEFHFTYQATP